MPIAYKFRAIKDGIINEFLALKDIPLDEAQNKITDFLNYFKILSIRKEIPIPPKTEIIEDKYSTAKDRWVHIPELMKTFPEEFTREEYLGFMTSKGLKFKSESRVNDDLQSLKKWNLVERTDNYKWKFIASEEDVKATLEKLSEAEISEITQASIPKPKQRQYMMYKNMADREYFTIRDWVEFMTTSPNNYDAGRIKNNFYHDIDNLLSTSRAKEIKTEEGGNYNPKRYNIIRIEPQAVEERVIKDLRNGQKVLIGTIRG